MISIGLCEDSARTDVSGRERHLIDCGTGWLRDLYQINVQDTD